MRGIEMWRLIFLPVLLLAFSISHGQAIGKSKVGVSKDLSVHKSCSFADVSFLPNEVKIEPYAQTNSLCARLTFDRHTSEYIEGSREAEVKSLYIDKLDDFSISVRNDTRDRLECILVVPISIPAGCTADVYTAGFKGLGVIRQRHRGSFDMLLGEYSKLDDSDFGFSVGVLTPGVHNFTLFSDFEKSGAKRLSIPCNRSTSVFNLGVLARLWVRQNQASNDDFQSFLGVRSFSATLRNQGRKWRVKKCT